MSQNLLLRLPTVHRGLAAGLSAALLLLASAAVPAADQPPGYALATAHPLATAAGAEILDAGGNAFDAAVAVSAALTVVEPYSSGIGGGGFWLLHRARDGLQVMVDGREVAPRAASADMYLDAKGVADANRSRTGALAAAIPGAPAAWVALAGKYGSQPLAKLLAPAIRLARDGFKSDARLAQMLAMFGARLQPANSAFMPGGKPATEGVLIRQPELAATLEILARDGRAGFYAGAVAKKLVDSVRANGGIWELADLTGYKVLERKPLVTYFRDFRVVSAPPPSAGGIALAQSLTMLEALSWPPADGALARHLVAESLRRVFRDRARYLGDPDFVPIPEYRLLSREYLLAEARSIQPEAATPSATLPQDASGTHTSHFSIIDAQGNRVAATLSINTSFGSGLIAAGTGVVLNNEMDDFSAATAASNAYGLIGSIPNAIAPGKRPLSSMTPTFVEGPRGVLVLGTPGGSRIISMVLLGVLGHTQGLDAAGVVALPRYHHQYLPDRIEFEPGALTGTEQAALVRRGHALKALADSYGNMQAVWWERSSNRLEAASDPRGVGSGRVKTKP